MKVSPSSNPLTYSAHPQGPSTKQQEWLKTFGRFFSFQENIIKIPFLKNFISLKTQEPTKTEKTASEILVKPSPKSTESQGINLNQILPQDPKVLVKQLDNGFTYYIRNHEYPSKQTASLRLVVRAGSSDEQPGEEGIAHFVEHLLFCETETYKKNDIQRFFESKGAAFGADQNAHTSFNETVYKFDIPLNEPELLDKALHILREMATKAKISDSSVEEERAIILDEICDKDAADRYKEKRIAALLEGTPYPNRRPAGLEKTVRECSPDQIRAFYQRNYLPQNMALIAVGDFDPKQAEELIQKHFQDIPPSTIPPITHDFRPIERTETQYVCHEDPESDSSILQVHYPLNIFSKSQETTVKGIQQETINQLYHIIFNKRFHEIISDSESPSFSAVEGSKTELIENIFCYCLTLVANDKEIPEAYKDLLLEVKRMQQHGFLLEELESATKSYQAILEHVEKEKNKISTKELAKSYASNFSKNEKNFDVEEILKIKKELVSSIKIEQINAWGKILTSNPHTIVTTLTPKTTEESVTPDVLKKIQNEALAEQVTPYANTFVMRPFLRKAPQPGNIINRTFYEKTGVTEWNLENGMRIYIKPSTQKNDTILMYASGAGGFLSSPFEKRAAAIMSPSICEKSGRAGLTPFQLKKVLNGKTVSQRIFFGNYLTTYLTTTSKKDLETAFQLIYTAHTDQAYKKEVFNRTKKESLNRVKHRENDPDNIFYQTEVSLCTQNHPRFRPVSKEEYENVEFQDCVDFLNQRFENPSNFDLVITGNLNLEETKELVEKYLAGIQSNERKTLEYSKLPSYEYPAGIVIKEIEAGIASDCKTHISFPAPAQDDFESRELGTWTAELLETRFNANREKSYKFECEYAVTKLPGLEKHDPSSMEIEFSSLPENIHEVNNTVINEFKRLQAEGFTKEEVDSYKTHLKESFRKGLDSDGEWMLMIATAARGNFNVNNIVEDFNNLFDRFDEKLATETFKKLFPLERYVQITLLPKKELIEEDVSNKKIN